MAWCSTLSVAFSSARFASASLPARNGSHAICSGGAPLAAPRMRTALSEKRPGAAQVSVTKSANSLAVSVMPMLPSAFGAGATTALTTALAARRFAGAVKCTMLSPIAAPPASRSVATSSVLDAFGSVALRGGAASVREAIVNGIPKSLRISITAGIGLFLGIISLTTSGVIVGNPAMLVTLGDLHKHDTILAIVGFFTIVTLDHLRVLQERRFRRVGGRIEQAVDAIAIEVERISEGQRFVTQLMSRNAAPALGEGRGESSALTVPVERHPPGDERR